MDRSPLLIRIAKWLAILLVCKTTVTVLLLYRHYIPPNFRSDFLLGRESYFFGPYQWAFYAHIASGPVALISGLNLLNNSLRMRAPRMHRVLGLVHVGCVLGLLTPSGLWMAWYANTGAVAVVGFACQAVLTAICAALGWQKATQHRYDQHRVWMLRCYVMLCSAVVLRIIGGLSEMLGADWTYPFAAWISWLVPLLVLELLSLPRLSLQTRQA